MEYNEEKPRLVPGVYGTESEPITGPFDFRCGQKREEIFIHNAGWYNKSGQMIGWGDLSRMDLLAIAGGLRVGEVFVIVREAEPSVRDHCGASYVADRAWIVIVRHRLYLVSSKRRELAVNLNDLMFYVMSREAVRSFLDR